MLIPGFPVTQFYKTRNPSEQLLLRLALSRAQEIAGELRRDLARRIVNEYHRSRKGKGS